MQLPKMSVFVVIAGRRHYKKLYSMISYDQNIEINFSRGRECYTLFYV